jgi:hypothetical protein
MTINSFKAYEPIETEMPFVPERSRLYNLEVMGMGTPLVEKLPSYIYRLAQAHRVPVSTLVQSEWLPCVSKLYPSKQYKIRQGKGISLRNIQLEGSAWVEALEALTKRQDLRFLTLLPWANVLSMRATKRQSRVWCPKCFAEWRRNGHGIYEPLLWSLELVTVCSYHERYLDSRCPNCQKTQSFPTAHIQPGYCVFCNHWLGVPNAMELLNGEFNQRDFTWQIWVTETIGELLAIAPYLKEFPTRDMLIKVTSTYLEQVTGRELWPFARKIHVNTDRLSSWIQGKSIPPLTLILQFCYHSESTILDWITGKAFTSIEEIKNPFVLYQEHKQTNVSLRYNIKKVKNILDEIIEDYDGSISLTQISRSLGYDIQSIQRYFPEHSKCILERYNMRQLQSISENRIKLRNSIRQAILDLHKQGIYPSYTKILLVLQKPYLYSSSQFHIMVSELLQELGLMQDREG